jgi:hypothetical protein
VGYYIGRPWTADYTVTITASGHGGQGPVGHGERRDAVRCASGGAASGTLYVGQLKNPAQHAGDHLRLEGGTASTTFSTAGDVTYTPFRFVTSYGYGCAVVGGPVLATTHVS